MAESPPPFSDGVSAPAGRTRTQDERRPGGLPATVKIGRMDAVVLVEGISDLVAIETLAERRGRNLEAEGVSIVPIGGAQAIGRFLDVLGPKGSDVRLAGICDVAEEGAFKRALERSAFGSDLT